MTVCIRRGDHQEADDVAALQDNLGMARWPQDVRDKSRLKKKLGDITHESHTGLIRRVIVLLVEGHEIIAHSDDRHDPKLHLARHDKLAVLCEFPAISYCLGCVAGRYRGIVVAMLLERV